jgi:hypothetical protein
VSVYWVVLATILLSAYGIFIAGYAVGPVFSRDGLKKYNPLASKVFVFGMCWMFLHIDITYSLPSLYTSLFGKEEAQVLLVKKNYGGSRKCSRYLELEAYHLTFFHHCISEAFYKSLPEAGIAVAFETKSTALGSLINTVATHPLAAQSK